MDRKRLTITLKKSLLKKIDDRIDGTQIRNRSHAIEYFLSQALKPKLNQAVILAGGKGVKMRPLTYEMPKALIPVGGKPLIEHQIELLRESDIRDIILAVGHLGEKIKEHIGNGGKYGVKITYSEEMKNLGTAGALANCYQFVSDRPFIVLHGDILVDIEILELITFHSELESSVATLALSTVKDPSQYGNVHLKGSKVIKFTEKPAKEKVESHLVSIGMYVCEPQIFDYIPEKMPSMLEKVFPVLAKERKLGGFTFAGKWFDISSPKNYEKAIEEWQ